MHQHCFGYSYCNCPRLVMCSLLFFLVFVVPTLVQQDSQLVIPRFVARSNDGRSGSERERGQPGAKFRFFGALRIFVAQILCQMTD